MKFIRLFQKVLYPTLKRYYISISFKLKYLNKEGFLFHIKKT